MVGGVIGIGAEAEGKGDVAAAGAVLMTNWHIEEFTVSEEEARFARLRASFSFSSRGRFVPPGTYRRLMRDGTIVMSDTPDELRNLWEFKRRARGEVLINGLGLGCAVQMALAKPEVTRITVIEIYRELIDLVSPTLGDHPGRLEIQWGDALIWRGEPGTHYGAVWHDIWDKICAGNLPDMKRLHRRYGRRCSWQGSWCRAECERLSKHRGCWSS